MNEAEALGVGGHLVTINDKAENTWLATTFSGVFARDHFGDNNYAGADIGYYTKSSSSPWEWISGEVSSYTSLYGGFPWGGTKAYMHGITHPVYDIDHDWNASPAHTESTANPGSLLKGIIERGSTPKAVPEPATLLGFGIPILMVGLGKLRQLRK